MESETPIECIVRYFLTDSVCDILTKRDRHTYCCKLIYAIQKHRWFMLLIDIAYREEC